MTKLRVLDLFSGIGGFSLGLERTGGFETVAFCEIDPFCRKVLAKHWPKVRQYEDVRELTADTLRRDGIAVDVVCGGFPCQDISLAGTGVGIKGKRSGLWSEYARLIGELRPRFVIVENVSALLGRGLGAVLGDLAALGFDAEWDCVPACALGAHHIRDRFWLVAYTDDECAELSELERRATDGLEARRRDVSSGCRAALAHADSKRLEIIFDGPAGELAAAVRAYDWPAEPDVGRVAYGVPQRVDRLRALGNAVVPQIPEMIGRAILAAEQQREAAA